MYTVTVSVQNIFDVMQCCWTVFCRQKPLDNSERCVPTMD